MRSKVCLVLPVQPLSGCSRALSLQLPFISTQRQRKCGNRNRKCQGCTRPAWRNRGSPRTTEGACPKRFFVAGRVRAGGRGSHADFPPAKEGVPALLRHFL